MVLVITVIRAHPGDQNMTENNTSSFIPNRNLYQTDTYAKVSKNSVDFLDWC